MRKFFTCIKILVTLNCVSQSNIYYESGTTILINLEKDSICIAADTKTVTETISIPTRKIYNTGELAYGSAGYTRMLSYNNFAEYFNSNNTISYFIKMGYRTDSLWIKINDSLISAMRCAADTLGSYKKTNILKTNTGVPFVEVFIAMYYSDTPVVKIVSYGFKEENGVVVPLILKETFRKKNTPALASIGYCTEILNFITKNDDYLKGGRVLDKLTCLIEMESKNPESSKMVGTPINITVLYPRKINNFVYTRRHCELE
jgi:hypothetical protein